MAFQGLLADSFLVMDQMTRATHLFAMLFCEAERMLDAYALTSMPPYLYCFREYSPWRGLPSELAVRAQKQN